MTTSVPLVLFTLDSLRLALPLAAVERVVPAAEITPLPGAPETVVGAFNLAGRVVPVLSLRKRFLLAERGPGLADHFLIVRSRGRLLALLVDEAQTVAQFDARALVPRDELAEGLEPIQGAVRLDDGMLLVNDPDRFLDPRERRTLTCVLQESDDDGS